MQLINADDTLLDVRLEDQSLILLHLILPSNLLDLLEFFLLPIDKSFIEGVALLFVHGPLTCRSHWVSFALRASRASKPTLILGFTYLITLGLGSTRLGRRVSSLAWLFTSSSECGCFGPLKRQLTSITWTSLSECQIRSKRAGLLEFAFLHLLGCFCPPISLLEEHLMHVVELLVVRASRTCSHWPFALCKI